MVIPQLKNKCGALFETLMAKVVACAPEREIYRLKQSFKL